MKDKEKLPVPDSGSQGDQDMNKAVKQDWEGRAGRGPLMEHGSLGELEMALGSHRGISPILPPSSLQGKH